MRNVLHMALSVAILASAGCDRLLCDERGVATVVSPDGKQSARAMQVSCGVTAQDGTFVYLEGPSHWYSVGHGTEVAMLVGKHVPKMSWIDDHTLRIEVAQSEWPDMRRQVTRWGSVSVFFPGVFAGRQP